MTAAQRHYRPALAALLIAGCVALLSSGCVQVRQELAMAADNTGKFSIAIAMPADRVDTLVTREGAALAAFQPLFDPTRGAELFPESLGFRVDSHQVYRDGDRQHALIAGRITDLKKALASGRLGPFSIEQTGDYQTLRLDPKYLAQLKPEDASGIRRQAARDMLTGLRFDLVVRAPAEIVRTSAPTHAGTDATWTFDLDENDDFLKKAPDISLSW